MENAEEETRCVSLLRGSYFRTDGNRSMKNVITGDLHVIIALEGLTFLLSSLGCYDHVFHYFEVNTYLMCYIFYFELF